MKKKLTAMTVILMGACGGSGAPVALSTVDAVSELGCAWSCDHASRYQAPAVGQTVEGIQQECFGRCNLETQTGKEAVGQGGDDSDPTALAFAIDRSCIAGCIYSGDRRSAANGPTYEEVFTGCYDGCVDGVYEAIAPPRRVPEIE